LSDLANSFEYLTIEKTCFTVSDSEKAKANRASMPMHISYKYLGSTKQTVSFEPEKTKLKTNLTKTNGSAPNRKSPMICCSLYNTEMSQGNTKFRIDFGKHHNQTMVS
jgi:hypothetical protein